MREQLKVREIRKCKAKGCRGTQILRIGGFFGKSQDNRVWVCNVPLSSSRADRHIDFDGKVGNLDIVGEKNSR